MGTSARMIERHYGALLGGAIAGIAGRLDAFDAEREQARDEDARGGLGDIRAANREHPTSRERQNMLACRHYQ